MPTPQSNPAARNNPESTARCTTSTCPERTLPKHLAVDMIEAGEDVLCGACYQPCVVTPGWHETWRPLSMPTPTLP